jgi:hypothetical protein
MTIMAFSLTAIGFYLLGAGTVVVAAVRLDNREQKSAPVSYAAATGATSVIESQNYGAFPGDWGGGIWNPRRPYGQA